MKGLSFSLSDTDIGTPLTFVGYCLSRLTPRASAVGLA